MTTTIPPTLQGCYKKSKINICKALTGSGTYSALHRCLLNKITQCDRYCGWSSQDPEEAAVHAILPKLKYSRSCPKCSVTNLPFPPQQLLHCRGFYIQYSRQPYNFSGLFQMSKLLMRSDILFRSKRKWTGTGGLFSIQLLAHALHSTKYSKKKKFAKTHLRRN